MWQLRTKHWYPEDIAIHQCIQTPSFLIHQPDLIGQLGPYEWSHIILLWIWFERSYWMKIWEKTLPVIDVLLGIWLILNLHFIPIRHILAVGKTIKVSPKSWKAWITVCKDGIFMENQGPMNSLIQMPPLVRWCTILMWLEQRSMGQQTDAISCQKFPHPCKWQKYPWLNFNHHGCNTQSNSGQVPDSFWKANIREKTRICAMYWWGVHLVMGCHALRQKESSFCTSDRVMNLLTIKTMRWWWKLYLFVS